MTIYLIPNTSKPEALEAFREAAALLHGDGVHLVADAPLQGNFAANTPVEWLPEKAGYSLCDMVLTIGGDGTMLHAARDNMAHAKPMAGINTGRLGFLTVMEQDELDKLHRLSRGEYRVEMRSVLHVEGGGCDGYALNDVVLFKQSAEKTIGLDIYCDDILVSSFRGDGVIFSTPTGSTAYGMSAGGPVVDARLDAVVVTQICAHILHTPPLVFDAARTLRVEQRGENGEKVFVSCDGLASREIEPGQPVTITKSDLALPLVQFHDSEQVKAIDKKLKGR